MDDASLSKRKIADISHLDLLPIVRCSFGIKQKKSFIVMIKDF